MKEKLAKFNRLYLLLFLMIAAFYVFVVSTIFRPNVSWEYKFFYIDTKLKYWPREGGLTYRVGDEIDFTKKVRYLSRHGWSHPERWGTWTNGKEAGLIIKLDKEPQLGLELIVQCIAFVSPTMLTQTIAVSANGRLIDEWEYNYGENNASFRTFIPLGIIESGDYLTINFVIPNATSPSALGLSKDGRMLGVGFKKIIFQDSQFDG